MMGVFFISLICVGWVGPISGQQEFPKTASWSTYSNQQIRQELERWCSSFGASDVPVLKSKLSQLESDLNSAPDRLDCVLKFVVGQRPQWKELLERVSDANDEHDLVKIQQEVMVRLEQEEHQVLKGLVTVCLARELTRQRLYDEALLTFSKLSVDESLFPEQILFYRATSEHQLLKREACLKSVSRLLENESKLPVRFQMLAKLMEADMRSLKEDSLDEVSRLMKDVRRRQSFYRSGRVVREEEKLVMKKLDRLIENLELQAQNQANQPSSGGDSTQRPLDNSERVAGLGEGEVQRKSISDGGEWGNMPPAKRAAALAEMAKDLPPHYRTVIEAYFRKLAGGDE